MGWQDKKEALSTAKVATPRQTSRESQPTLISKKLYVGSVENGGIQDFKPPRGVS